MSDNKTLIKLVGYTPYAFSDRSRDTYSAIDLWTLEVEVIPKNVKLRNYLMFDYQDGRKKSKEESLIPALGSRGQVIGLRKNKYYLDTELLFVPKRLLGRRFYRVPESEISLLEQETRESEDSYWQDRVEGSSPVTELLLKSNPRMLEACHFFEESPELNERSAINSNVHSEDIEIFFRPTENCNRYDCPICRQVEKFVEAHNKANKKAKGFALLGRRFDDPEAIKFDNLKGLEELIKLTNLTFNAISLDTSSIWDTWRRFNRNP